MWCYTLAFTLSIKHQRQNLAVCEDKSYFKQIPQNIWLEFIAMLSVLTKHAVSISSVPKTFVVVQKLFKRHQ